MNALERRSVQRKGWLGLGVFALIPVVGIALFTASMSLFFAILLGVILVGTFAIGGFMLKRQLQLGKRGNTIEGVSAPRDTFRPR